MDAFSIFNPVSTEKRMLINAIYESVYKEKLLHMYHETFIICHCIPEPSQELEECFCLQKQSIPKG